MYSACGYHQYMYQFQTKTGQTVNNKYESLKENKTQHILGNNRGEDNYILNKTSNNQVLCWLIVAFKVTG